MINTAQKIFLTLCAVTLALPFVGASERAETLRAINWVENPTNHTRPGSRGELGPYQFLPQTWRLHTRVPFRNAVLREQADVVAVKHYEWIKDGLVEAGIDPNPFNIALAWNCGLGAVKSGRVPAVSYVYAERVQNLVERQRAHERAAQAETSAIAQATGELATKPALAETPEPMFAFNPAPDAPPRFMVETGESLFELTIRTEKSPASPSKTANEPTEFAVIAPPPDSIPTIKIAEAEKPIFTVGGAIAPRVALIR